MQVFISGGCKNGKSTTAQRIAYAQRQPQGGLYYLATMSPCDAEDDLRILRHQQERQGQGFATIEQPRGLGTLAGLLTPQDSLLLDSLTAWLGNEMFTQQGIQQQCATPMAQVLEQLLAAQPNLVIVSDYIYGDGQHYDAYTEQYRQGLARLDSLCAARSEGVLELCGGNYIIHKGGEQLEALL